MAGAFEEKYRFDLDGGRISLDFVNTVSGLRGVAPREHLFSWQDLVWWAQQAGLVTPAKARKLHSWTRLHPRQTEQEFKSALRKREALHEVALAAIEKREPRAEALGEVNEWIAEALAHRRLRPARSGRLEMVFDDDDEFLAFLRPVALDAADLLEREIDSGRARICEESACGRCGWLFFDQTRNHSRRYCSMADCGNRAKQRRFQERKRG